MAVIEHIKHKGLKRLFETGKAQGLIPSELERRCKHILNMLADATRPQAMALPGFRFHPYKGNRKGTYGVDVNGPWRITFTWGDTETGGARNVNLEQEH